jgi:hypothetical protein
MSTFTIVLSGLMIVFVIGVLIVARYWQDDEPPGPGPDI